MNINQNMDKMTANQESKFLSVNEKNIAKNIALFYPEMLKDIKMRFKS
jgi:hypothetical protein